MDPRDLAELLERRREEFLDSLSEMVNTDSGSFSPVGVNRVADMCEKRFSAGGWEVERRPHEPGPGREQLGDLLVGRLAGAASPRILMIGHMDTVFPDGTASERPFTIDGKRAKGPGVSDMKSGLLFGFFAAEVLQEAGAQIGSLTYVCNPDEEIGSPFSGPIIKDLAASADVALVLESARESGDIVSARKGVSDVLIEIRGKAAHAGVEPESGRSAVLEAAHKTIALHELNGKWPGVTVNVGVIGGGTRPNVVPDACTMQVDIRAPGEPTLEQAEAEIRRICESSTVEGTTATAEVRRWHRPMEKSDGTARLVDLARRTAGELGFDVRDAATGGASDANTTAAAGVPTLDGLGPVGGGDHGPDEWMDLDSVVPRSAMLASVIERCGAIGERP